MLEELGKEDASVPVPVALLFDEDASAVIEELFNEDVSTLVGLEELTNEEASVPVLLEELISEDTVAPELTDDEDGVGFEELPPPHPEIPTQQPTRNSVLIIFIMTSIVVLLELLPAMGIASHSNDKKAHTHLDETISRGAVRRA